VKVFTVLINKLVRGWKEKEGEKEMKVVER
jgi:hypothetical protein